MTKSPSITFSTSVSPPMDEHQPHLVDEQRVGRMQRGDDEPDAGEVDRALASAAAAGGRGR